MTSVYIEYIYYIYIKHSDVDGLLISSYFLHSQYGGFVTIKNVITFIESIPA